MADAITVTMSGATLVLIGERLFAYLISPRLQSKPEKPPIASSTSGDKDPAFWQKEFRDAVMQVNEMQVLPWLQKISEGLERLAEAHADVIKLLQERSALFQQQTDLLRELVDVNRRKRR